MSRTDFDIAVVGGSLAGSTTVLKLAGSASVAFFEKDHFPRRKVCGEGLSPHGKSVLDEVGHSPHLSPVRGYKIWKGRGSTLIGVSQSNNGVVGYGVRRENLDFDLFQMAVERADNVIPFLDSKVRDIEFQRDRVKVLFGSDSISVKKVVIADGAKSLIAGRTGIPVSRGRSPTNGASLSCLTQHHFDEVQLVIKDGYEAYITPVSDGVVNVSFLGTESSLKDLFRRETLRAEIQRMEDIIGVAFTPNQDLAGTGAIAPISRPPFYGPILLVGDACESLDPVCGMGMTHALVSGGLAGSVLRKYFTGRQTWSTSQIEYAKLHRSMSRRLRGYSRVSGTLIRKLNAKLVLQLSEAAGLPDMFHQAAVLGKPRAVAQILSTLGVSL